MYMKEMRNHPKYFNLNQKKSVLKFENKASFRNLCYFYLKVSSIHGLNHIVEKGRAKAEIIVWVFIVLVAIICTLLSSLSTWQRFQNNPTVISLERGYQQWNTTFPAITVCPLTKMNDTNLAHVIDKVFDSVDNRTQIEQFVHELAGATYRTFDSISSYNGISPKLYKDLILNASLKLEMEEMTSNLVGFSEYKNWIEPVMLELGLCYTFHSAIVQYYGVGPRHSTSHQPTEPIHQLSGNPFAGDVFIQIINMNTGGYVYLHNSNEVPDTVSKASLLNYHHFETIEVTAMSIISTDEVSSLNVEQRKCRYLHESPLAISPVYTYNLCRMNCRMKLSLRLCDCVPYFYWSLDSNKFKICDIKGMYCLDRNKERIIKLQEGLRGQEELCVCLPPCDDTNYLVERDISVEWYIGTNLRWGIASYPRVRFKRDILFGLTDLLVAFGGSAALFLGCSVLSFIEIIYYWLFLPLLMCIRLGIKHLHRRCYNYNI